MTRDERLSDMRREAVKIWQSLLADWKMNCRESGAWSDSARDLDEVKDALDEEDKDLFAYAVDEAEAERIVLGTMDDDCYELDGFDVCFDDFAGRRDPCSKFLSGYMKSLVEEEIDNWYKKAMTSYVYEVYDPESPQFCEDFAGKERVFRTELYVKGKLKASAVTKNLRKAVEGAQALEKAYPDKYVAIVYKDTQGGKPCDMMPEEVPRALWKYADFRFKYPSEGEGKGL